MYDIEALRRDADARDVAEYIGMNIRKCGSNYFAECVSGQHSETQYDHNAVYKGGCHCFSCGANYSIFKMVRAYYENVLGQPISFPEVLGIVGDALGGRELYMTSGEKTEERQRMPLSDEELRLLGLDGTMRGKTPRPEEDLIPGGPFRRIPLRTEEKYMSAGLEPYRSEEERQQHASVQCGSKASHKALLTGMFLESREEFNALVSEKARERIDMIDGYIKTLTEASREKAFGSTTVVDYMTSLSAKDIPEYAAKRSEQYDLFIKALIRTRFKLYGIIKACTDGKAGKIKKRHHQAYEIQFAG